MTKEWIHDDGKRLDCLYTSKVYKDFCRKFGGIMVDESGEFAYMSRNSGIDNNYRFPVDLTDEQILEAVEKSMKDGHDYLLDLIGKPENKVPECDSDCDY